MASDLQGCAVFRCCATFMAVEKVHWDEITLSWFCFLVDASAVSEEPYESLNETAFIDWRAR